MTKDEINRLKKTCGEMLLEFNTDTKKVLGRKLAAAFWYGVMNTEQPPVAYITVCLTCGRVDELVEMPV